MLLAGTIKSIDFFLTHLESQSEELSQSARFEGHI